MSGAGNAAMSSRLWGEQFVDVTCSKVQQAIQNTLCKNEKENRRTISSGVGFGANEVATVLNFSKTK